MLLLALIVDESLSGDKCPPPVNEAQQARAKSAFMETTARYPRENPDLAPLTRPLRRHLLTIMKSPHEETPRT